MCLTVRPSTYLSGRCSRRRCTLPCGGGGLFRAVVGRRRGADAVGRGELRLAGRSIIGCVALARPLASQLMQSTALRTERLELRPVRDEDVDRILEYRNLPEVT